MKSLLLLITAAVLLAVGQAAAEQMIEVKDGVVNASLVNAPLGQVITEIGKQSGFKTNVNQSVYTRQVTTSFTGLQLKAALDRILALTGARNYLLQTDPEGKVASLKIYEDKKGLVRSAQPQFRPGTAQNAGAPPPPPPGRAPVPRSRQERQTRQQRQAAPPPAPVPLPEPQEYYDPGQPDYNYDEYEYPEGFEFTEEPEYVPPPQYYRR